MKRLIMMAVCGLTLANGAMGATIEEQLDSLFEARYGMAKTGPGRPSSQSVDAPGGAVLIAKGDSVIYEGYFGIADMETGEPINEHTRFNIASVSKQFTVCALLQTGVDIDRPVSDFFKFPQKFWRKVTLRHLASHTSGVPDSRDRSDRDRCVYATDEDSEAYFPTVDKLKFKPGEAYDYLNPSFILLARVVEQVSGQDFIDYQQSHIFDVAGMSDTYYFDPAQQQAHTAHGYVVDETGRGRPSPQSVDALRSHSWREYDYGEETFFGTRPDGGIYSTARDMLKWELALASGRILPLRTLRMAYTPHIEVTGSEWCDYQRRPDTWYGLGWFVDTTEGMPVKVYHTGDNGGFQAYVAKYPKDDISIIVLENRHDQDRWAMAKEIDRILYGK